MSPPQGSPPSGGSLLAEIKAKLDGLGEVLKSTNERQAKIEDNLKRQDERRHAAELESVKAKADLDSRLKDLQRGVEENAKTAAEAKAAADAVKDRDTVSKSTLLWSAAVGVFTLLGSAALMAWWSGLIGG